MLRVDFAWYLYTPIWYAFLLHSWTFCSRCYWCPVWIALTSQCVPQPMTALTRVTETWPLSFMAALTQCCSCAPQLPREEAERGTRLKPVLAPFLLHIKIPVSGSASSKLDLKHLPSRQGRTLSLSSVKFYRSCFMFHFDELYL